MAHTQFLTLKRLYYSPDQPSAYRSKEALIKAARKHGISRRSVIEFLLEQPTYTSHREARKRFPTSFYNVFGAGRLGQIDLLDVQNLANYNQDIRYLMCLIDVFSKVMHVRALRDKKSKTTASALKDILDKNKLHFEMIEADMGSEWRGHFASFLKDRGIKFRWAASSLHKAAVVERAQKTLRSLLFKYMYANQTNVYYDVLQSLVDSMNNAPHRSLKGRSPSSVRKEDEYDIWMHNYLSHVRTQPAVARPKFAIGDHVRISKIRGPLDKGTKQPFTEEIFVINRVMRRPGNVFMYQLMDEQKTILSGWSYEFELSPVRVNPETLYKISKILRYKGKKPNRMALVEWQGLDRSQASWVKESDIEGYKI